MHRCMSSHVNACHCMSLHVIACHCMSLIALHVVACRSCCCMSLHVVAIVRSFIIDANERGSAGMLWNATCRSVAMCYSDQTWSCAVRVSFGAEQSSARRQPCAIVEATLRNEIEHGPREPCRPGRQVTAAGRAYPLPERKYAKRPASTSPHGAAGLVASTRPQASTTGAPLAPPRWACPFGGIPSAYAVRSCQRGRAGAARLSAVRRATDCAVGSGEWAEPPHSPWTLRRRVRKSALFWAFSGSRGQCQNRPFRGSGGTPGFWTLYPPSPRGGEVGPP